MDPWQPATGTKSLDLNGFGPGGIEQTFATKLNASYVVEFSLSGNPGTHDEYPNGDASPSNKTLTVHATGGLRRHTTSTWPRRRIASPT